MASPPIPTAAQPIADKNGTIDRVWYGWFAALKPAASTGGAVVTGQALTAANDTNVTLTLGGTPATALLQATSVTLGWTGILAGARGGTNNGFLQFSGPATSLKTFTLPNASDTISCLGTAQTWTAPQSFNSGDLVLNGAASGSTTVIPQAAASGTWNIPSGTDQFAGVSSTQALTNKTISGSSNTLTVLAATQLSGQVSISNGGTGQATASAAFDALSPNTTLGDLAYRGSSGNTRLAGNTTSTRKFLRQTGTGTVSAAPAWDTIVAADVPGSALTGTNDTNLTLTLGGSASTALLNAASITLGWTGTLAVARGGTGGGTASGTLLDNITGFASTGILVRTGAGTYAFRTLTAPAAGITVTNGNGVAGNQTLALANDLAAVEGLAGTGIARRTGTDAWSVGTLVTYAEIQNVSATNKLLGRSSVGAGTIEEIDIGAWTANTPTVSATSGTFTTVTASLRYKVIGKSAYFSLSVTMTDAGTASGNIICTLPISLANVSAGGGKEVAAVGYQVNWQAGGGLGNNIYIAKYDNTSIIGTGRQCVMSGVLELA